MFWIRTALAYAGNGLSKFINLPGIKQAALDGIKAAGEAAGRLVAHAKSIMPKFQEAGARATDASGQARAAQTARAGHLGEARRIEEAGKQISTMERAGVQLPSGAAAQMETARAAAVARAGEAGKTIAEQAAAKRAARIAQITEPAKAGGAVVVEAGKAAVGAGQTVVSPVLQAATSPAGLVATGMAIKDPVVEAGTAVAGAFTDGFNNASATPSTPAAAAVVVNPPSRPSDSEVAVPMRQATAD